jgi:NodT family efflux transporter outer membrane factor (OMF) lipoprotein
MKRALLASCALITACVNNTRFESPRIEAPDRYANETLATLQLDAASEPGGQWWKNLNSPELDATIDAAFAGNRNLAMAQASLREARELFSAQTGARLPSAELAAGEGRQKYGAAFLGPNAGSFPPFTYYTVGVNVSYLLDYAGGTRNAIEQRLALAEVRQHTLEAARLSLAGNIALQALQVASAREQLRAVQSIVEEGTRNVELVQKALDAGSVARLDLLTAQSQLADDETLLPPLRQQLSAAQHALAVLVGRPPASFTAPDFELAAFRLPSSIPLGVPSELAHRRPDIRADEARLHAATAAVGVATANLYPQIRITGSLSRQSLEPSDVFDDKNTAFSLVTNITAPLFNGGRLRAERRAALAAVDGALASYQQTVLTAFAQVADTLTALEHDAELIAAQQKAFDVAQTNLSLARESFSAGNTGVLQILDAQRLSQRARIGVVRAQAQQVQDLIELMVALGGEQPAATPASEQAR